MDWRLLVEEGITNIGIPLEFCCVFAISMIFCNWNLFWVFLVFANQPTVHAIVGDLAWGGSVAVAVGVSYR